MSAPAADAVQESVRAKVRTVLTKSLNAELATALENKLAIAFPANAAYTSAYRSLVALLKPRSDTQTPDASLSSPPAATAAANGKGKETAARLKDSAGFSVDLANLTADLLAKKVKVGHVINKLQQIEKDKSKLLREAAAAVPASGAAATAAAQAAASNGSGTLAGVSQLDAATQAAIRARGIGKLMQQINSAKIRLENSAKQGGGADDPLWFEEIADCSLQLFLKHVPNQGYLNEALKAYNRVEALSSQHVAKHPAFYLKRAAIHTVQENFAAAIQDLETYAAKEGTVAIPAVAAAPAASTDATASAAAPASTAAAPSKLSYASVAAPRLFVLRSFVSTTSRVLASRFKMSESDLSNSLATLPNPSERELQRAVKSVAQLHKGANEGAALVGRLLGKLDQSSLWSLQNNINPRVSSSVTPTGGSGVPLPLPNLPYDGLDSAFHTPSSYAMVDTQGVFVVLSFFNLAQSPAGKKRSKALLKAGAALVLLDPTVREVNLPAGASASSLEATAAFSYRIVQIQNPYSVFADRQQVFTADDLASTAE